MSQSKKSGLIFTYGITNSGKTFTVIGNKESPGILPKTVCLLLELIEKGAFPNYKPYFSLMELYNEQLFDLLAFNKIKPKEKIPVDIRENKKKVFVENLVDKEILSFNDFFLVYKKAVSRREQGSNIININSSRSHNFFMIILENNKREEITLTIVDLAVAERVSKTQAVNIKLKEAAEINKSLFALSNCFVKMQSNSTNKTDLIIPFHESKLTRLLSNAFTQNHKTMMILNISQGELDFEEIIKILNTSCIAADIKVDKTVANK